MSCSSCNNKGYHESHILKDNTNIPLIVRCPNPNCPYISKYYSKIKQQLSSENPSTLNQIIDKQSSNIIESLNKDNNLNNPVVTSQDPPDQELSSPDPSSPDPSSPIVPDQDLSSPVVPGPARNRESNQVPSNTPLSKVKMDTEYPNLPKAIVDKFKEMIDSYDGPITLSITTPLGVKQVKDLEDANRVFSIINQYNDHDDDLSHAYEQDNVTVFPLSRSLGIE